MKNLSEKALLVSLKIGQWSARKYDRKATEEVNQNHNSKDAGRFNKILVAKEGLQEISKVANKTRAFIYENTLPWSDSGERLLPADNYFEYMAELSKLKSEFQAVVNKFVSAYPAMIEDAKINLNGLFNAADYPLNIAERFYIKPSFMPVPDTTDIRVNLSEGEVKSIKAEIESEMNERFAAAQRDIYQRVIDQLKYMHERLTAKDDDKNKDATFRDSLFTNVLSLVEILPRLNVASDPKITEMCSDLKGIYTDPQSVRESKTLRASKAKEVEVMLSKIDSFLKPV